MKKYILTIFILLNLSGFSQQINFNKAYAPFNNNPNTGNIAGSIAAFDKGYIVPAVGFDTIKNHLQSIIFYKFDTLGNATRQINFTPPDGYWYYSFYYALQPTHEGGYVFTMNSDTIGSNNKSSNIIVRFNSDFDTLWTKNLFPNTSSKIIYHTRETSDKCLICVGFKVINSNLYDVLLVKTDSLANILWEKTISLGKRSGSGQIIETQDKGFLIVGNRGTDLVGDSDPFVIKTDSIGNLKWYRILGGNQLDGGIASAKMTDGNYIVAYGIGTYTYPWPNDNNFLGRLNVLKLNLDGVTIWDKIYDTIKYNYSVNKIQILSNNDFIVMGTSVETNIWGYNASYLFKFNSNGDSLFRKKYFYSANYWDYNLLYDNVLNSDGSITAIGKVQNDTIIPANKIWIVKTDTNLYAPGCYPTGVTEYITQKDGSISIFPNPVADDHLNITYSFSDIYKNIQLIITDATDRLVYQSTLNNTKGQHKLSVKDFASGSYNCNFYNKDKLLNSLKFIRK
jgi:hypothetical protein